MRNNFTFIALAALFCLVSGNLFAQTVKKDVCKEVQYDYLTGEAKPETPSTTIHKFYDTNGLMVMDLTNTTKNMYTYNEAGQLTTKTSYYLNSDVLQWNFSTKISYEYDSEGNVVRENSLNASDEITGYTLYENFENGYYQDSKSMSADGSSIYYWQHFELTFDNNILTSKINSYKPTAEETVILSKTVYTYTDGLLQTEELLAYINDDFVSGESGTSVISYSYDTEGNLTGKSTSSLSRWGNYTSDLDYVYNDYSADYIPTNFTAVPATGDVATNAVTLSWDAATSSDVTGYMVICDTLRTDIITETSYTTTTDVINGEHFFAVVAVVNGNTSNISTSATLEVYDEGVIPAENTTVTNIGEYDESLNVDVTVTWDAPTTNSEIVEYRVYYSEYSYEATTETTATLSLGSWITIGTDEYGDEIGLEVPIYVVAVYTTGIADPSNTVVCIPLEGTTTGINDAKLVSDVELYPNPTSDLLNFTTPVSVELYNLSGSLVKSTPAFISEIDLSGLAKGMYVFKLVDEQGFSKITKVILK